MIDKNEFIEFSKGLGFKCTKCYYISVYAEGIIIAILNFEGDVHVYDCNKFKLDEYGNLTDERTDFYGTKVYDFETVKVELIKIAKKIKSLKVQDKIGRIEKDF